MESHEISVLENFYLYRVLSEKKKVWGGGGKFVCLGGSFFSPVAPPPPPHPAPSHTHTLDETLVYLYTVLQTLILLHTHLAHIFLRDQHVFSHEVAMYKALLSEVVKTK